MTVACKELTTDISGVIASARVTMEFGGWILEQRDRLMQVWLEIDGK